MSQHNHAARQPRSPRQRAPIRAADAATRLLRVLALEDDADTCEALELLLCPEDGFELRTTSDICTCLEGLRLASAARRRPYDVLLLDLALPGGRWGTEVIDAAQADPHICLPAVVVCTAVSGAHLDAQLPMLEAYGARIVPKPFDVDDLVHTLRQAACHRDS